MKSLYYFLVSALLVFSIACEKSVAACDPGNLEDTIIGSWTVTGSGSNGDVEFKSDGTLIDEADVLAGVEDEADEKSYVINSNSSFDVSSTYQGFTLEIEYEVKSYTCDEIILDVFGFEMKMNRK